MSRYQHTKGQIKDNAIEALLHDPLFRLRVEKNKKGKGSYQRKDKHAGRRPGGQWQASESLFYHWPSAFCVLIKNGCFVLLTDREFHSVALLLCSVPERQALLLSYGSVYSSV